MGRWGGGGGDCPKYYHARKGHEARKLVHVNNCEDRTGSSNRAIQMLTIERGAGTSGLEHNMLCAPKATSHEFSASKGCNRSTAQ